MFAVTINEVASKSDNFRKVIHTSEHTQVVLMTLKPGEEIGSEVHEENDQVLTFVQGTATAEVGGDTKVVSAGDLVVVPAGTEHNFTNTGDDVVRLYTIYGPPDHDPKTVHKTKAQADKAEKDGSDVPPQDKD